MHFAPNFVALGILIQLVVKEKSTKTSKTNWAKLKNMDNTEIDYSDTPECIVIY